MNFPGISFLMYKALFYRINFCCLGQLPISWIAISNVDFQIRSIPVYFHRLYILVITVLNETIHSVEASCKHLAVKKIIIVILDAFYWEQEKLDKIKIFHFYLRDKTQTCEDWKKRNFFYTRRFTQLYFLKQSLQKLISLPKSFLLRKAVCTYTSFLFMCTFYKEFLS